MNIGLLERKHDPSGCIVDKSVNCGFAMICWLPLTVLVSLNLKLEERKLPIATCISWNNIVDD